MGIFRGPGGKQIDREGVRSSVGRLHTKQDPHDHLGVTRSGFLDIQVEGTTTGKQIRGGLGRMPRSKPFPVRG